ncbi:MacB family efflux pump subunit [Ideonella sp. B7]|uniref:MacB family efflux pump subunit n=1 Tax=Ideonella benzenivorans TaxID=2831643 RepID=UPI001CECAEAB|nr:MacB family efflux pump subunit [Ideonella benzenivorans]MCA6218024.1 MacB family efflux pump subunit [Ideonella benzenivorans]
MSEHTQAAPLLDLRGVGREFPAGEGTLTVLQDINLQIQAGEMVAIVGQSGSGKSTLMNLIGCLDQASRGRYAIAGREVAQLRPDELAELRREHFGFIFQRYHLLSDLTAQGNVEVPAIYAGLPAAERHSRAQALLQRLGLGDRTQHVPGKLSGGQQQRVSIARALMNGGSVILADEPTGALDSGSGEEVMRILGELHAQGQTIIIVTHDMGVARHAERIVELKDGRIVSDAPNTPVRSATPAAGPHTPPAHARPQTLARRWRATADSLGEAFHMALLAMNAHRLRTLLTMLGIVIGIASVVSVVALGRGSQQKVLANISSIGTNTIEVFSGLGFGDPRSARIQTLRPDDADALAEQSYVDSVTPNVQTSVTARVGNIDASVNVNGVGEQYFRVKGLTMALGTAFDANGIRRYAQVAVIDDNAKKKLFPTGDPIGQVLFLGSMPVYVVGVTAKKDSAFGPNSESLNIFVPYTTAMRRLIGQGYLRSITVRVDDSAPMAAAEQGINQLLERRHGRVDFYVLNTDSIRQTIESTTQTLTLLIASIAVISLVVGGIGVMNIMLVSVTERTAEIGVRMAVGARQRDIQQQFLIEAVLVCLLGGVLGIAGALGFGALFSHFSQDFALSFSPTAMGAAFLCATLIGVVFGYLPARSAARLNPVEALSRD